MKTYVYCYGDKTIPDDKNAIFAKNMLTILNVGGMMSLETVNMYDRMIIIQKPVPTNARERVSFNFNYFEDDRCDESSFEIENIRLLTGKMGNFESNKVITAAYSLYQVYDTKIGYITGNNIQYASKDSVGWINSVLATKFSLSNRLRIWEHVEQYVFRKFADYDDAHISGCIRTFLIGILSEGVWQGIDGREFADIIYVIRGTEELDEVESDVTAGGYIADIRECKQAIKRYFATQLSEQVAKFKLWSLLKKNYECRKNEETEDLVEISKLSLRIPARVFVYLTTEHMGNANFWEEWHVLKEQVYSDEILIDYVSDELKLARENFRYGAVEPVATSEYLKIDDSSAFSGTPKELEGRPDYHISDADRLYWWRADSEEVSISDEVDAWIKELVSMHAEIKSKMECGDNFNMLKSIMETVNEINDYYKRIYLFQDMFYEFIENGKNINYVAAIELLRQLGNSELYKKQGKVIECVKPSQELWSWEHASRNVVHNVARLKLKRYLSILANVSLRKQYFGF